MSNKNWTILTLAFLLLGCKTKKLVTEPLKNVSAEKDKIETVGHLKMRVIDYEITDSSDVRVAEMMVKAMKSSIESELIFNGHKSADLVKTEEGSGYVRRLLYDRSNKKVFQFLSKGSVNYYSEVDIEKMMSKVKKSPEDETEIGKMLKLKKYPESGSEILGFKCDELILLDPTDSSKVRTIIYSTDKIPSVSEAMGPLSQYFTGAPLKTIMFVNGIKITFGAIEYTENPAMQEYLGFNRSKYKKLTAKQFEKMKNSALERR